HHAHAFGSLLDDRRLAGIAALRRCREPIDKAAKRGRAATLKTPREVEHSQRVRERLLPGVTHREPRMRAGRIEQAPERVGDRPPVAEAVQLAEDDERVCYGAGFLVER